MLTTKQFGDGGVGVGRRVADAEHQCEESRQLLLAGGQIRGADFRERLRRRSRQVHAVRSIRRRRAQRTQQELDHRVCTCT